MKPRFYPQTHSKLNIKERKKILTAQPIQPRQHKIISPIITKTHDQFNPVGIRSVSTNHWIGPFIRMTNLISRVFAMVMGVKITCNMFTF